MKILGRSESTPQFDVYRNPSQRSRGYAPYVVARQSDIIDTPGSVVVAPLVRSMDRVLAAKLQHPAVVEGQALIVMFATPTTVSSSSLGVCVGSLPELKDFLVKAIDHLFVGH